MSDQRTLRTCPRCGEQKPLNDFAWKHKELNQRQVHCRACKAHYGREHYLANRQAYIDRARSRTKAVRRERTQFLLAYFQSHPCVDCGEDDPPVLEFDHLEDKAFTIGTELAYRSWASILEEIEKCEVVCANCHRRRTARRSRWLRAVLSAG